jgi:hypothetical protein
MKKTTLIVAVLLFGTASCSSAVEPTTVAPPTKVIPRHNQRILQHLPLHPNRQPRIHLSPLPLQNLQIPHFLHNHGSGQHP